jgi:hypothetical protein
MKLLLCFLGTMCLTSCMPKLIPLKGNYPVTPIIYNSTKSFDKCWDRLIDVFAQKGLTIKIIDRTSGLLISDSYALTATVENKNGVVENKDAFIAIGKLNYNGIIKPITGYEGVYSSKKKQEPNPVYGEWNVRLKSISTGGTSVNININTVYYEFKVNSNTSPKKESLTNYKTTGVFEKLIFDLINN